MNEFATQSGFDEYSEPQRLSVMAVVSLVLSLLCVTAPLGALAGIISIFSINASKGRVRGTGLAIVGTVLGLLLSVVWLALVIGGMQAVSFINERGIKPTNRMMLAMEASDNDAVRAELSPSVQAIVSDEDISAFREAYTAEHGAFAGIPQTIFEMFPAYAKVGDSMDSYGQGGSRQNEFPMPAEFDSGWQLLIVRIDQHPKAEIKQIPILNVSFLKSDGTEVFLIPVERLRTLSSPGASGDGDGEDEEDEEDGEDDEDGGS